MVGGCVFDSNDIRLQDIVQFFVMFVFGRSFVTTDSLRGLGLFEACLFAILLSMHGVWFD